MSKSVIKSLSIADQQKYLQAHSMMDLNNYADALIILTQLILKYDSKNLDKKDILFLYYYRGWLHFRLSSFKEAIIDFDLVLKNQPKSENILFLRARSKESIGLLNAALYDYDRLIEIAPLTADAYSNMGMIFEYKGQIDKAKKLYLKSRSIDMNDVISNIRLKDLRGE